MESIKRILEAIYTSKNFTMARSKMGLLLVMELLVILFLPNYSTSQLLPVCLSQFALANEACAVLPSVASEALNTTRLQLASDDDNDNDEDDGGDSTEDSGHRDGHGNGNGNSHGHGSEHGNRRKHGNGHRNGHDNRHRHGSGPGGRQHGNKHEHGGKHRNVPRAYRDCCRWLDEVNESCVCTALLRLPIFLVKAKHQYSIKVENSCSRTFNCHGV